MSTDRASAVQFTPDKLQAGAIDPDAIPSPEPGDTPRHALAWTTNIRVRPVDHDTIQWDAGQIEFSDGTTQVLTNSNSPRTLSPDSNNGVWYVYKRFTGLTLQFTQNFSTAIGSDRIQLGIIVTSSVEENMATVLIKGDSGGPHISAQSIAVNVLSAITANLGEITAGTLTALLIQSSAANPKVRLNDEGFQAIDADGIARVTIPTTGDLIQFTGYGRILGEAFNDLETGLPVGALVLRPVAHGVNDLLLGRPFANFRDIFALATERFVVTAPAIALQGLIGITGDLNMNNNRILNAVLETVESDDPTATLAASSTSITAGSSVVLSWTSANGVSASINHGVGAVAPVAGGSVTVTPASTRTYTLTVTGADGTTPATASVTITVSSEPDPDPDPPTVDSFTATPSEIDEGDSLVLAWQTTGATSVSIPGVGSNLASDGSATVSPTSSRSYTITATNDDGSDTDTVDVTVNPAPSLPTIDSFSASPTLILLGSSVQFSWSTTGATSVNFEVETPGGSLSLTGVSQDGSRTVTPVAGYKYRIRATNAAGTVSSGSISITVLSAPRIDSMSVNPSSYDLADRPNGVTIRYQTTLAQSCRISGGQFNNTPTSLDHSGLNTPAPSVTTTYTLRCYEFPSAMGRSSSRSVTVTVT